MAVVASPGTSSPVSWPARSAGVVVNALVLAFQLTSPPVKGWVTTSPFQDSSAVGTPRVPADPPSLSHAALMAPRTTQAPLSGVQKMTGLSAALNVLFRLSVALPAPSSMVGKPRSLSAAPPSAWYLSRIAP